ncbi:MAG: DUF2339 domain-containing protein [Candidatus Pacebacteria bacterium]|nr:DUF2339 domain-containing protein [Candidatus Paceibacterota bacterium]
MFELLSFLALVLAGIAFTRANDMQKRLTHVERYLQQMTTNTVLTVGEARAVGQEGMSLERKASDAVVRTEPLRMGAETSFLHPVGSAGAVTTPGPFGRFVEWLREDWLMKLGGGLIILGVAWFVSYAVAEGWIAERGRIASGYLAGSVVLVLGWYRMQRFITQGSVLMVVGAAMIGLTTFAARTLYDLFPASWGLVIIFSTACLLALTSIVMKRHELAYANVLLAGLAPLLIHAPHFPLEDLLTYLFVVALGSVWVAALTGWRDLPFTSLIIVTLYSLLFVDSYSELEVGLLFSFAFTALFFVTSIAGMRVVRAVRIVDLLTAIGSGMFLLLWVLAAGAEEWQSMLLIAWTLVFALGAFFATRLGAGIAYFYAYAGVGTVLLGVATALELDGPALTVAATIEAALVLWVGYRISRDVRALPVLALACSVPAGLTLLSIDSAAWNRNEVFHSDSFVIVFTAVVATLLGYVFLNERLRVAEKDREVLRLIAAAFFSAAALYATVLVWLVTHALFSEDTGTTVSLVVYALVGSFFYMLGRTNKVPWQRLIAGFYFGFVVVRLIFVEIADMPVELRWITFFGIGVLFMLVAWFSRNGLDGTKKV